MSTTAQSAPERAAAFVPAAIGLALFIGLVQLRMDDPWAAGSLFVAALIPAALVLALGVSAARERTSRPGAPTVLLVAGLALAAIALARFGQVLAGGDWTDHGGTLTLVLALFVVLNALLYRRTSSVACLLLAALAAVGLLLEAVNWIFDTEDVDVFRALLLVGFVTLFAAGISATGRAGTILVGAAGVTALATSFTFGAIFFLPLGGSVGWGWELVMLLEGLALVAYAAIELEPGPAYIALFVLAMFVLTAAAITSGLELDSGNGNGGGPSHSLVGWPLAIGIGTALAAAWAVLGARRAQ